MACRIVMAYPFRQTFDCQRIGTGPMIRYDSGMMNGSEQRPRKRGFPVRTKDDVMAADTDTCIVFDVLPTVSDWLKAKRL